MGIFEKALKEQPAETLTLTPHQAFAAIVIGAIGADGRVGPTEAARVNQVFASTRLFAPPGAEALQPVIEHVMEAFDVYGADAVVGLAAQVLPPPLHAAAFAVAVDLVLADGQAGQAERHYIDRLQELLQIDDAMAVKIVDVMLLKNSA